MPSFLSRVPRVLTVSVLSMLLGACVTPVDAGGREGPAPSPSAAARTTPVASTTPLAAANAAVAAPSPTPLVAATMDVTPAQVAVGSIVMSLAFQPPRHMVDQVALSAADPAQQQMAASSPDGPSQGAVVLSDMIHVTN